MNTVDYAKRLVDTSNSAALHNTHNMNNITTMSKTIENPADRPVSAFLTNQKKYA